MLFGSTTTVANLTSKTYSSGYHWVPKWVKPKENQIYVHIDGPEWNPIPKGPGRWFGQYVLEFTNEAKQAYNLPPVNPATHAHLFKFIVPESNRGFCYFESRESCTGIWQAVLPMSMIKCIKRVDILVLR